jgi:hypothetical protein
MDWFVDILMGRIANLCCSGEERIIRVTLEQIIGESLKKRE